jgi:hypothetical protein
MEMVCSSEILLSTKKIMVSQHRRIVSPVHTSRHANSNTRFKEHHLKKDTVFHTKTKIILLKATSEYQYQYLKKNASKYLSLAENCKKVKKNKNIN